MMKKSKMTLNQVYNDLDLDHRIFYALQWSQSGDALPWNRQITHNTLDRIYFMTYSGDKKISKLLKMYCDLSENAPYIDTNNNIAVGALLRDYYIKKWWELYNTLNYEYNPITNYDMTETETINTTDGENATGQHTETPIGKETHTTKYEGTQKNKLTKSGEEQNETEYSGTQKDKLTKSGEEQNETEYSGKETNTIAYEGQETNTTEYTGTETETNSGTRTNNRTFTPEGEEWTSDGNTEIYNSVTDTATEWGVNATTTAPPEPQNTNVKTGSITRNNSNVRSFIGRLDTTVDIESFDDYAKTKGFSSREDTLTKDFDDRTDTTTREFDDRKDTNTLTFNNRYDENEKSFQNRKDTNKLTFTNRFDEDELSFTNRQDSIELSFSDDRQTIIDTSNELQRSSIVSRTLTRSGNIGVTTTQQMIQAQRELLLWDYFYKIVFPDIDKLLTLCIY